MDEVHGASAALLEFSRSLRPHESCAVLLSRLAERVVGTVKGADGVTVTLFDRGQPDTIATTDRSLLVLDKTQYQLDDGPCLCAIRTQEVVRTDLDRADVRWPELRTAAAGLGVRTALSCPLFVPEDGARGQRRAAERELSGALNVFSRERAAFDPVETALLAMFCSAASGIIMTAAHWSQARSTAEHLLVALDTRDTIATAKGIVMARLDLDQGDAFRWLVDASQRTNRKLHDLAVVIVEDPSVVPRPT